jgi:serine/arginine repetitive matrix protein 2
MDEAPVVPELEMTASQAIDPASVETSELHRPLTPPPNLAQRQNTKQDSPHHIPDFDFEDISLHAIDPTPAPVVTSPIRTHKSVDSKLSESASRLSASSSFKSTSSLQNGLGGSEFGSVPMGGNGSTTTRVRQRISREMVRETIQQRIADGSLSRKGSIITPAVVPAVAPASVPVVFSSYTTNADKRSSSTSTSTLVDPKRMSSSSMKLNDKRISSTSTSLGIDKALPPPPAEAFLMRKAVTTDATVRIAEERPSMRPRSQTQSAHDVLKQNEKDGVIGEPQSALDRLIGISSEGQTPRTTTKLGNEKSFVPVSILQKPTIEVNGLMPPPLAMRTPSGVSVRAASPDNMGIKEREQAILAKRKEKGVKENQKSVRDRDISGASRGSRRSRRSMSTGDVAEEAEQVSLLI